MGKLVQIHACYNVTWNKTEKFYQEILNCIKICIHEEQEKEKIAVFALEGIGLSDISL